MKKLIIATLISCFAVTSYAVDEPKFKTVCHDKKDKAGKVVKGKDGKPLQDCKKIKVHKKLEGTKVPDKK